MLWMLAIALAWASLSGTAPQADEPATYWLVIASRPLDEALQEFSKQSGIQVVFFSRLTQGIRAPALDGRYTMTAALGALLAGSKLTFRVINSRTVEIRNEPE